MLVRMHLYALREMGGRVRARIWFVRNYLDLSGPEHRSLGECLSFAKKLDLLDSDQALGNFTAAYLVWSLFELRWCGYGNGLVPIARLSSKGIGTVSRGRCEGHPI